MGVTADDAVIAMQHDTFVRQKASPAMINTPVSPAQHLADQARVDADAKAKAEAKAAKVARAA